MGDSTPPPPGGTSANLFAPVQAPRLTSISRKAIQRFLAERAHYESAVAAQPGLIPVSWAGCIETIFLQSLLVILVFGEGFNDVSDLNEDIIKAKLTELSFGSKPVSFDEALADVKRNVRLDPAEPDARIRILMLQAIYVEHCKRRGWGFVNTAPKAAVKHIIAVLQPPALKSRVEDALRLEKNNLKDEFFGFSAFLAEQAELCESFHPLRSYRTSQKGDIGKNSEHTRKEFGAPVPPSSGTPDKKKAARLPHCLNPECLDDHFVKDCKITSDAKKKTLLEAHRAAKKEKKNSQGKRVSALNEKQTAVPGNQLGPAASPSTAPNAVLLAEIHGHKFACRIDSGADEVVISDTIVKFLGDNGHFLPTLLSTKGRNFNVVDGHAIKSPGQVQISPKLNTVAGPCRVRNIKAFIMPCNENATIEGAVCAGEIILGNPFLVHSGLNVTDFIAENIDRLSSLDYGNLHRDPVPTKVGKLGLKLLSGSAEPAHATPQALGFSTAAPRLCPMIANSDLPLVDGDDINYKDVEIGDRDEQELEKAIDDAIRRAAKHLPNCLKESFRNMVLEYKDIFRIRLGINPPVSVPPMEIKFEGTDRPVKVRQRTYSPEQLEFMKKKCDELLKVGCIYRNLSSKWACAPLIVPKDVPEGFRFTVDLRPVNAQTKKHVWPMPHADPMLAMLAGASIFFKLDFIHGYWQFPLAESSQECQSFHTPFGVFTPNGVLHGATNSVSYFQSTMESMFSHLDLLICLLGMLGYVSEGDRLIVTLKAVFDICLEKGLKLNPRKCDLVEINVPFCGRLIDSKGIKFHPRQYGALTSMKPPTTVGELMELVDGANWMRTSIPRFSELIEPLHKLSESLYSMHKTRVKFKIRGRPLSAWGDEHQAAFTSLIQEITHQATLSTPDPAKRLCLFTDASSTHWAGVLTQVDPAEIAAHSVLPLEWNHSPVAFVSGSFRGRSSRWTTPEKERYGIVASVTRLSHILAACGEFSLFTDHKNILYMLSPTRFNANVARHIVHKTHRWALRPSEFNFTVEHIPVAFNTLADLLIRWAAPGNEEFPVRRFSALRVPLITAELPEFRSLAVISKSQLASPPSSDAGATNNIVKEKLHWSMIDADIKAFVQSCLVCTLSSSGSKIPRPLFQQIHVQRESELLHFDFLYIGESRTCHEYILILKDDFSGYVFLRPCKKADAETTANVLKEYFTTFVRVLQWFFDQCPHFCNKVMQTLASSLGVKHRFSTVCAPRSNGTIESVCKEVLRVMHAFNSETLTPEADWPNSVQAIQIISNNSPSRRLGGRAPITVHTGMPSGNPLTVALADCNIHNVQSLDQARFQQNLSTDRLLESLDKMHKDADHTLSCTRKKAVECHNAKTHVVPYKPSVGDYVFIARIHGPRTKMSTNWVGPRRISRILSDFTVEIDHPLSNATAVVHVCCVKPYADASVGAPAQMQEVAEFTDRIWYSVDKIKDVREAADNFEVLVAWKGLTTAGDSWEPLSIMFEDVPFNVRDFFRRRRRSTILRRARASIGL